MKTAFTLALIVVLSDTGQTRDGLPVFIRHPQSAQIAARLDRGVTGELVRVYRLLQVRQQRTKGGAIEPAYLLLSNRQGGYAKYGFWLGAEKKPGVAYVDVYRDWRMTGEFGAIDQIFPHELSHAILHLLGIEQPKDAGSNQVHAIGVRTDRFTAYNEGLAEHFQIMAVDHPGAAAETRALAVAQRLDAAASKHLAAYRRELTAYYSPLSRMRIGFPLWYSNDERTLRYFAVKENRFAREPVLPSAFFAAGNREDAYLLENVLPGDPTGPVKSVPRLIASEGAVSALFYRWATDRGLQNQRGSHAFYEQFGTTAAAVSPLQNAYLKLYAAAEAKRTADVPALVNSYREMFPEDAPLVDRIISESFHGSLTAPPQLWLANGELKTGTTLFDQFRGLPRIHTFDLNAASIGDLTSVRGITPALARSIMIAGPYLTIDGLSRVPGVTPELIARMKSMSGEMQKVTASDEEKLTLKPILIPYLWRALIALLAATIAGAIVYRFTRMRAGARTSVVRTAFSALGAALAAILVNWVSGNPAIAIAAVAMVFGIPAALWQLYRTRRFGPAVAALIIWAATALPGVIVTSAI